MQRPLVICCGNADRGDDGAGLLVAHLLAESGIEVLEHSLDGLALIEAWSGAERAILVDAVVTGAAPGTIIRVSGESARVLRHDIGLTHSFGVADAIELARELGRMPKRLEIIGIEGSRFEPGTEPAPVVAESAARVASQIREELESFPNESGCSGD